MNLKTIFVAAACALALPSTAFAQTIVLRGITPWQPDYDMSQAFMIFHDLVNERLPGRVEVQYLGGPEVVQPDLQVEALNNGIVDVVLTAAAYYRAEVPAAAAVMFTSKSPTELRESGYADLMREVHAEEGIQYLASAAGGKRYRLYLNTLIDGPDLSGLTIRVSPVYLPLVRALGGTPISVAPNELYTALERNMIQGYGWPETGTIELGLHEKTRYVVNHPFYLLDTALLMNKQVYDGLPEDIRLELEDIAVEFERLVEEMIGEHVAAEDARLAAAGLEFITFGPEDAASFLDTANTAGWDEFVNQNAALIAAHPDFIERHEAAGH